MLVCPGTQWMSVSIPTLPRVLTLWLIHVARGCDKPSSHLRVCTLQRLPLCRRRIAIRPSTTSRPPYLLWPPSLLPSVSPLSWPQCRHSVWPSWQPVLRQGWTCAWSLLSGLAYDLFDNSAYRCARCKVVVHLLQLRAFARIREPHCKSLLPGVQGYWGRWEPWISYNCTQWHRGQGTQGWPSLPIKKELKILLSAGLFRIPPELASI